MRQSTRLIVNSVSTLGRMAFTVAIGLLVTRLLVQYLGTEDFGLVLALGATGAMLQFVTSALTSGVQRQLAYGIGVGDVDGLRRVFSTAWLVFTAIGAVLWLIGVALTPVIMHVLTIPPARANAAWWVYQISLVNLVLAVTGTPFQSLIISHQHLVVSSVVDALFALARFAAVLLLLVAPWDLMVSFSAFQLAGFAAVRFAVSGFCLWRYPESLPRSRYFDFAQLKEITRIASWSLLNQLSLRFRTQGGVLLLNIFFGPVVNAGYGVSVQVSDYALNLAQALRLAVMPAIVGAHAKGNQQNVHRLALVAGKYTVLLASLIFVPIWLEAFGVMNLWLGDVPPHTVIFVRLIIAWTLVYVFGSGYQLALFATGDLGWYTRLNIYIAAAVLTVSAIGFYFGLPPWFLPAVTLLGMFGMTMIAVFGIGAQIGLSPRTWFYEAMLPTLGVLVPATIAAAFVHWTMPDDIWRILAVTVIYGVVGAPLIWWVALASWERQQFFSFAKSAVARLQRANS